MQKQWYLLYSISNNLQPMIIFTVNVQETNFGLFVLRCLGMETLSIDQIDELLGCIRLRSEREDRVRAVLSAWKSLGSVPVDIVRGKIHIVDAEFRMDLIDDDVKRRKEIHEMDDRNSESRWVQVCYMWVAILDSAMRYTNVKFWIIWN